MLLRYFTGVHELMCSYERDATELLFRNAKLDVMLSLIEQFSHLNNTGTVLYKGGGTEYKC